jgi:hypothetical protein
VPVEPTDVPDVAEVPDPTEMPVPEPAAELAAPPPPEVALVEGWFPGGSGCGLKRQPATKVAAHRGRR